MPRKASRNYSLFGEIWDFMKVRKKWWLLPIVLMLAFVFVLIFVSHSAALSPFIYAFF